MNLESTNLPNIVRTLSTLFNESLIKLRTDLATKDLLVVIQNAVEEWKIGVKKNHEAWESVVLTLLIHDAYKTTDGDDLEFYIWEAMDVVYPKVPVKMSRINRFVISKERISELGGPMKAALIMVSKFLYISPSTIRRNLKKLEKAPPNLPIWQHLSGPNLIEGVVRNVLQVSDEVVIKSITDLVLDSRSGKND